MIVAHENGLEWLAGLAGGQDKPCGSRMLRKIFMQLTVPRSGHQLSL